MKKEWYVKTANGEILQGRGGMSRKEDRIGYVLTDRELNIGSRFHKRVGKDSEYICFCDKDGNNEFTDPYLYFESF